MYESFRLKKNEFKKISTSLNLATLRQRENTFLLQYAGQNNNQSTCVSKRKKTAFQGGFPFLVQTLILVNGGSFAFHFFNLPAKSFHDMVCCLLKTG